MHVQRSIIYNSQKAEATQVPTDRLTDKQNVVLHAMEYYSALKRKEILPRATIWLNLEDIMLSEISQYFMW